MLISSGTKQQQPNFNRFLCVLLCIIGPGFLSAVYGPWIAIGFFTFLAVVSMVVYSGISQRGYEFFGFIEAFSIGLQIFMSVPIELNDSGLLRCYLTSYRLCMSVSLVFQ